MYGVHRGVEVESTYAAFCTIFCVKAIFGNILHVIFVVCVIWRDSETNGKSWSEFLRESPGKLFLKKTVK